MERINRKIKMEKYKIVKARDNKKVLGFEIKIDRRELVSHV